MKHPLTERQLQVLELRAADKNYLQMAELLRISPKTVRNHLHSICFRLDVHTSAGAVARGFREGWLR